MPTRDIHNFWRDACAAICRIIPTSPQKKPMAAEETSYRIVDVANEYRVRMRDSSEEWSESRCSCIQQFNSISFQLFMIDTFIEEKFRDDPFPYIASREYLLGALEAYITEVENFMSNVKKWGSKEPFFSVKDDLAWICAFLEPLSELHTMSNCTRELQTRTEPLLCVNPFSTEWYLPSCVAASRSDEEVPSQFRTIPELYSAATARLNELWDIDDLRLLTRCGRAVVAGGSVVYAASGKCNGIPCSDVDLFVLCDNADEYLSDVAWPYLEQLQKNPNLCVNTITTRDSVLTIVCAPKSNPSKTKTLQIIRTSHTTAVEVVLSFDLISCMAFWTWKCPQTHVPSCDAFRMHPLCMWALQNSTTFFRSISTYRSDQRIHKARLKGFRVVAEHPLLLRRVDRFFEPSYCFGPPFDQSSREHTEYLEEIIRMSEYDEDDEELQQACKDSLNVVTRSCLTSLVPLIRTYVSYNRHSKRSKNDDNNDKGPCGLGSFVGIYAYRFEDKTIFVLTPSAERCIANHRKPNILDDYANSMYGFRELRATSGELGEHHGVPDSDVSFFLNFDGRIQPPARDIINPRYILYYFRPSHVISSDYAIPRIEWLARVLYARAITPQVQLLWDHWTYHAHHQIRAPASIYAKWCEYLHGNVPIVSSMVMNQPNTHTWEMIIMMSMSKKGFVSASENYDIGPLNIILSAFSKLSEEFGTNSATRAHSDDKRVIPIPPVTVGGPDLSLVMSHNIRAVPENIRAVVPQGDTPVHMNDSNNCLYIESTETGEILFNCIISYLMKFRQNYTTMKG